MKQLLKRFTLTIFSVGWFFAAFAQPVYGPNDDFDVSPPKVILKKKPKPKKVKPKQKPLSKEKPANKSNVRVFSGFLISASDATYTSQTYDSYCTTSKNLCYQSAFSFNAGAQFMYGNFWQLGLSGQYLYLGQALGSSDSQPDLNEFYQYVPVLIHGGLKYEWLRFDIAVGFGINLSQVEYSNTLTDTNNMAMIFQGEIGLAIPIADRLALEISGKALLLRQDVAVDDGLSTLTETRSFFYAIPTISLELSF